MGTIPDDVKLFVMEKLDDTRKEHKEDLEKITEKYEDDVKRAGSHSNKVLAFIAVGVSLITLILAFIVGKVAVYQHFQERGADTLLAQMKESVDAFNNGGLRLPIGTIIPVAANAETISKMQKHGWAICDGNGGTPNLTGRFLLGTEAVTVSEFGGREANATGLVDKGDLNRHQHESPQIHPGANTAVFPNGSPFGRGSNKWPQELCDAVNRHSAGTGEDGAPHDGRWKLTNIVYPTFPGDGRKVDLNAHTHSVDLPPYYTVVYMMRVK